jgi:hypothetical protein
MCRLKNDHGAGDSHLPRVRACGTPSSSPIHLAFSGAVPKRTGREQKVREFLFSFWSGDESFVAVHTECDMNGGRGTARPTCYCIRGDYSDIFIRQAKQKADK